MRTRSTSGPKNTKISKTSLPCRGPLYPIALEGALKLKEISYIHAEGYAAGEMKHGPIALIDAEMPVLVLLKHGPLFEKMISNIQEVKARDGIVLGLIEDEPNAIVGPAENQFVISPSSEWLSPVLFSIPLQLLAYHVAVLAAPMWISEKSGQERDGGVIRGAGDPETRSSPRPPAFPLRASAFSSGMNIEKVSVLDPVDHIFCNFHGNGGTARLRPSLAVPWAPFAATAPGLAYRARALRFRGCSHCRLCPFEALGVPGTGHGSHGICSQS